MSAVLEYTYAFAEELADLAVMFGNSRVECTGGNCYALVCTVGDNEVMVTNGDTLTTSNSLALDACTAPWVVAVHDADGDIVGDTAEAATLEQVAQFAEAVLAEAQAWQEARDAEGKSLDLADCGRADR
jgi:hypothetical protein